MPINYQDLTLTTDLHLFPVDTTVAAAYRVLFQDPISEAQMYTYLVIPSASGMLVVRWVEIEVIAGLTGADITDMPISDLANIRLPAGATLDRSLLPEKFQTRSLDDLLAILRPVALLDEQEVTTQQARRARDSHPGRRALVVAQGRIKGLIATTYLGSDAPKSIIRRLLRAASATLGLESTEPLQSALIEIQPATSPDPRWQPRRIEAAMPQTGLVGRVTEVWVKLSLPDSAGLAGDLPDHTKAGDLVGTESIVADQADIEFSDPHAPTVVYVQLDAPGFTATTHQQAIQVRPGKDSAIAKLLLTPNTAAAPALVNVLIYQDLTTHAAIATLTLTIAVQAASTPLLTDNVWQVVRQQLVPVSGQSLDGALVINYIGGDFISMGNISNATVAVGRDASAQS